MDGTKTVRHQSKNSEAPSVTASQHGPLNLIALPSSTAAILVTVTIALFLLTYLGIQALPLPIMQSNRLAGLTKAELLDARANPMLMESNIGVSAAIVSQLERICSGLPELSDQKECRWAIYPEAGPAPEEFNKKLNKLNKSVAEDILTDSKSRENPKIDPISKFGPVPNVQEDKALSKWKYRLVSYSVSAGGGETTVSNHQILWFQPQDTVRDECWYQNAAPEESYKASVPLIASFFERLGSATSGGGIDVAGVGTGHVGRAYIMFPSGDIMIWVPPSRKIEDERKLFADIPIRRLCLINRSVYFTPPPRGDKFQYTGLYLDSAGLGFNATVFAPKQFAEQLSVAAIDLTFDPDSLAGRTGSLTKLVSLPTGVAKWSAILDALGGLNSRSANDLKDRVNDCLKSDPDPEKDAADGRLLTCSGHPLSLNGSQDSSASASSEGGHAIAVFLGQSKWLVAFFPRDAEPNPFLPALIALCLVGSVGWLSMQRLRSHVTFRTLLSTLDTMNVPLIVSDPNSDHVHVGNEAAARMGLAPVEHFGPQVVDIEDQEMYKGTQTPGRAVRAYVVRIRVRDDARVRYALFRSAPIDRKPGYLSARLGDRLSIVLPMDPSTDLASLSDAIDNAIRFKLANLLDHGVLAWTRVLEGIIEKDPLLAATLVKLIQRNQTFIISLFSWGERTTALPGDVEALDEQSIRSTVDLCKALFAAASADENIRRSLNLVNGTLSGSRDGNAPFELQQAVWPERAYIHVLMKGAVGFFLGESLRNAIRHGKPGTTPIMTITVDRLSQFVRFEIRNAISLASSGEKKSLGGVALMREGARKLHWRFDAGPEAGRGQEYLCWWEIPLVRRSQA